MKDTVNVFSLLTLFMSSVFMCCFWNTFWFIGFGYFKEQLWDELSWGYLSLKIWGEFAYWWDVSKGLPDVSTYFAGRFDPIWKHRRRGIKMFRPIRHFDRVFFRRFDLLLSGSSSAEINDLGDMAVSSPVWSIWSSSMLPFYKILHENPRGNLCKQHSIGWTAWIKVGRNFWKKTRSQRLVGRNIDTLESGGIGTWILSIPTLPMIKREWTEKLNV